MTTQHETPPGDALSRVKRALLTLRAARDKIEELERSKHEAIAIVGMSCRFPGGGTNKETFFQAMLDGVDAIRRIPKERWSGENFVLDKPEMRWAGLIDDVDQFDAAFFGISPREASQLDPQQRLLLEVTWEALELAGQTSETLAGSRTGVFIGMNSADYLMLLRDAKLFDTYGLTGNLASTAAGRLSYTLGLEGPCVSVDTACSSSLVAMHLAVQSLRNRECDMAIVGGVGLLLDPMGTILMAEAQALSPDGRCKTFDARANGLVSGEGCGIVVLKRLPDAQRDGDPIAAILCGSAMNQDGRSTGLTTPNVLSQQSMLRTALDDARIRPEQVEYVETHGTGTSLGDPIEFAALRDVLGAPRADGSHCILGALKTNIGHLAAAAGIAGLIKTVLCLQHGLIPKNLHFETLNPRMLLEGTPFVIPTETQSWKRGEKKRIAGVSAFGISGTNVHSILEEAPLRDEKPFQEASSYLLPLSAKTPEALAALARSYQAWLSNNDVPLHHIAYTASIRRSHFEHRIGVVGATKEQIVAALGAFAAGQTPPGIVTGKVAPSAPKVVFVFPGQGSQWVGMGRQLYQEEPAFRDTLVACDEAIRKEAGFSVIDELNKPEETSRLSEIDIIQPVLFAIEVALAALWRSWRVEPAAVVGHSMGEVAAAFVAGALSMGDAAAIICRRSRLLRKVSGKGTMALVELSLPDAEKVLIGYEDRLSVAVNNGPRSTVIAGDPAALEEVLANLERASVFCRRVKVDVASHSPQMDPLRDDLLAALADISPQIASIPMRSTVTGERVRGDEMSAIYWADNLRRPVLFSQVVEQWIADGQTIFLEMSPHPILAPSVEENLREAKADGVALASLRRAQDERQTMLSSLGTLFVRGVPVAWNTFFPAGGHVVELPTYPWQKERFWFDSVPEERSIPRMKQVVWQDVAPEERNAFVRNFVRDQVASVARMNGNQLDSLTPFKSIGMDSLMALEVRRRIEEGFSIRLSATLLWQFPNVDALSEHLLVLLATKTDDAAEVAVPDTPTIASRSTDPTAWIHRAAPVQNARMRLFCLPYAGVGASRFHAWSQILPTWIDVCPIQLPGREERLAEPPFDEMEPLVDALVNVLENQLDLPFALFGCSVGGVVAFELARVLRIRFDASAHHLFVAACASPDRVDPMQRNLSTLVSMDTPGPDAVASLRALGILSASDVTDPELLRAVWPALRADIALALGYRHLLDTRLGLPITVFGGVDDRAIGRGDLAGWHAMTTDAFQLAMIPGGHLFMDTSTKQLLSHIERVLRT